MILGWEKATNIERFPSWIRTCNSLNEIPEVLKDPEVRVAIFAYQDPSTVKSLQEVRAKKLDRFFNGYSSFKNKAHKPYVEYLLSEHVTDWKSRELVIRNEDCLNKAAEGFQKLGESLKSIFPELAPRSLTLRTESLGTKRLSPVLNWHPEQIGKGLLAIWTAFGPSTEFAETYKGKGKVLFPDGMLVIQKIGNTPFHRAPFTKKPRLAATITLESERSETLYRAE